MSSNFTKVGEFKAIYNFVVYKFFVWDLLESQSISSSLPVLHPSRVVLVVTNTIFLIIGEGAQTDHQ